MGMYTQLALNVDIRRDAPAEFVRELQELCDGGRDDIGRKGWMLKSGGSYYFAGAKLHGSLSEPDSGTGRRAFSVWTDIKNYEREWQWFLDFIAPYVDCNLDTSDLAGFIRYEEDDLPTLIYFHKGRVVYIEPTTDMRAALELAQSPDMGQP